MAPTLPASRPEPPGWLPDRDERKARGTYLVYRAAAGLARVLPEQVGESIARGIAQAAAAVLPGRRRLVERNLRRATDGRLRGWALRRAVYEAFDSYGRYWFELFRLRDDVLRSDKLEERNRIDGFDRIEAAVKAGRGAIAALPHVGGWEYAGAWLAARGYPPTVVVEPVEPPELFEWFADVRRALGMDVVPLGPAAGSAVLKALEANRVVCLVCDRDLVGDGIEVEFFGERTTLPAGPAVLALRSGAPLFPAAVYFEPRGRHHGVIEAPIDTSRQGRLRDDVTRVTQALARRFEVLISAAPEQWHLMQPNWPSDREKNP